VALIKAGLKISEKRAKVFGGWVMCPLCTKRLMPADEDAAAHGIYPYCPTCKTSVTLEFDSDKSQ
jgi:hypothetical protein